MKNTKIELNENLSEILGNGVFDNRMDATKSFFAYAKANNLLDGDNKKIILDAKLEKIFGKSTLTYFGLTEELLNHSKLNKILNLSGNQRDENAKCHILKIGFIPVDCSSDYIYTGDPESCNTQQITFKFFQDKVVVFDSYLELKLPEEFYIDLKSFDISEEDSKFWVTLAKFTETAISKGNDYLDPIALAKCFLSPQNAARKSESVVYVAGIGSEFDNEDGKYNGFYYVGYEFYDGRNENDIDVFIDESVYVIDSWA
jgi:hypothetical protein